MANKELTAVPAASLPLDGTEYMYIVQGGNTRYVLTGEFTASAAEDVTYDNTTSGLGASDVQTAIDELALGLSEAGGALTDGDKGDMILSGSSTVWTIDVNVVTNTKLADVATATIKGRATAGTGDPEDLTGAQATALLDAVVGDSGSGGTKGLVPAPASGDAAAGKFLKADGTWTIVTMGSGGGGGSGTSAWTMTVAASDETTDLTTGDSKVTFFMPADVEMSEVFTGVSGQSSSGSVTIDLRLNGATVFSTPPSVQASEDTSLTGTVAVLSIATFEKGDKVEIDVDAAGTGASGLKVTLIGTIAVDPTPYDVPLSYSGTPAASEVIGMLIAVRDIEFAANFAGSAGGVGTNPTATFDIDVQDDGVSIGTISVSTGGAFTFTTTSGTAKTVASGSVMEFIADSGVDATIENIAATLKGAV